MDESAPSVEKPSRPPKNTVKRPKGLTKRDGDGSAGRNAEAAAVRITEAITKKVFEPKPLEILPFESTLAYVFKGSGGKQTAVEAARMAQEDDPRLKKMVYAWDSATERDKTTIKLEDLCSAADITPDEFLGLIIPALWRRNLDIGKLIAAMAHPQVVEASIQAAKTQWGSLDRQMLHTASGFLPTKAGQQINIDNRKQIVNANGTTVKDTSAPGLPSFEQDAIEGAETLRGDAGSGTTGRKQLPAPRESQAVVVPSSDILDAEPVE